MNFVEKKRRQKSSGERTIFSRRVSSSANRERRIRFMTARRLPTAKPAYRTRADPCYQGYDPEIPHHERATWYRERPDGIPTDCRESWKWRRCWPGRQGADRGVWSGSGTMIVKRVSGNDKGMWEDFSNTVGFWADIMITRMLPMIITLRVRVVGAETDSQRREAAQGLQDRSPTTRAAGTPGCPAMRWHRVISE